MRRTSQGMIPVTAFASAALTLALLFSEGSAESAFTISGPANIPLWIPVGFLTFAAGLVVNETAIPDHVSPPMLPAFSPVAQRRTCLAIPDFSRRS